MNDNGRTTQTQRVTRQADPQTKRPVEGHTYHVECDCGWTQTADSRADAFARIKAHKCQPASVER